MSATSRLRILRTVRFCAGHRYHSAALSEEENREVFGACNRPHGHGHNYRLEVGVEGPVDPVTGMVINLADLDKLLREIVVDRLDHSFLNYDVDYFADLIPSCENLVGYLWSVLEQPIAKLGPCRLSLIRLWESEDLFAELEKEPLR